MLQSSLGYVLQEPHLFSGTIRDNIRYSRREATDAEVEEAARLCSAEGFILKMRKAMTPMWARAATACPPVRSS